MASTKKAPRQPLRRVPFNRPAWHSREVEYVTAALKSGHRHGDGSFTERCQSWLESVTRTRAALLTTSCTSALELAAILAGIGPGDEVIMPSFTFVSTANAFVLRGAVPVFVDIDPQTQNIDPDLIEPAITPKTKAIVPVHYAGVGCDMDPIMRIAQRHGLIVIEDAAQGLLASYRGQSLGSIGHLGALSFHDTKNTSCGEGGALLVNDEGLVDRAYIVREKGTNRRQMMQGLAEKYTWVDIGSSFLPSDVTAAFLLGQLEDANETAQRRRRAWNSYHHAFAPLEAAGLVQRPVVMPSCQHNGHLYYLLLRDPEMRPSFISKMQEQGVGAPFHYVPLHDSPAGRRFGRVAGSLDVTTATAARLVRLPLWRDLSDADLSRVVRVATSLLRSGARPRRADIEVGEERRAALERGPVAAGA